MPSFKSVFFSAAAVLVAAVSAQDYWVEPESVTEWIRVSWCNDQETMCPAICRQTDDRDPLVNTCDEENLTYGCICGDGKKPNMSEYSLTLPYHVCVEWGNQCVKNCGNGNNVCASACREENPCGAQNPTRVNVTSSSASAGPSATGSSASDDDDDDGIFSGTADSNNRGSGNDENAAAMLQASGGMTLLVLVGIFFGGFAVML